MINKMDGSKNRLMYDVFVSYRQQEPGMSWVRKNLLKDLENAGLKVCIDYKSFEIGEYLIKAIEKAIEQSSYTLAVLTPSYLESNFTELENYLAQHLGLQESQRRLVVIIREPCKPRLSITAALWLDMTDDEEYESNINKLIKTLIQPNNMSL